jgi:hypothetical protein
MDTLLQAIKTVEVSEVDSSRITAFKETPRKRGKEKPVSRIGAFSLFQLFTADIIRSKKVFTR